MAASRIRRAEAAAATGADLPSMPDTPPPPYEHEPNSNNCVIVRHQISESSSIQRTRPNAASSSRPLLRSDFCRPVQCTSPILPGYSEYPVPSATHSRSSPPGYNSAWFTNSSVLTVGSSSFAGTTSTATSNDPVTYLRPLKSEKGLLAKTQCRLCVLIACVVLLVIIAVFMMMVKE